MLSKIGGAHIHSTDTHDICSATRTKVYKRTEPLSHDLIEMMDAKEHKAADNETMMMIADLYGVDVDELVKLNKRELLSPSLSSIVSELRMVVDGMCSVISSLVFGLSLSDGNHFVLPSVFTCGVKPITL